MSKYNRGTVAVTGRGPLATEAVSSGKTHEGGTGYARDVKSELFLRASASFAGEDSFYEAAAVRDDRLRELVHGLAVTEDGFAWLGGFLPWLRGEGNIRTAPLLLAAETVRARLAKGLRGGNRQLVSAVLQRADEPGEMLAYWTSRYGRAVPKPVKRGIADAIGKLYSEYALLKYDTASHGFRFADVIELAHPSADGWRGDLFKYALDRRHNREDAIPSSLSMIQANAYLRARAVEEPEALLDAGLLKAAGMTWEDALSLAGSRVSKKDLWSALGPSMGYMALIRNLRNMDEAGVSDDVAGHVAARIADPAQVAKSRQLPFRFLSAYLHAPSLRWGHTLEKALDASLGNIPDLPGRTLVLIDTSGSMGSPMSGKSKVPMVQAAALFGLALAMKNPGTAEVWGFADGQFRVDQIRPGLSVLKATEAFCQQVGRAGHGTQIEAAVRATYAGHDRVAIFTDMQTFPEQSRRPGYYAYSYGPGNVAAAVPAHIPVYGFNLAGYTHSAMPVGQGNRHELGGLTDATFRLIPLIERGLAADWPWIQKD
jgi:hypothetical protein